MHAAIEANKQEVKANKQDSDGKMIKFTEEFKAILARIILTLWNGTFQHKMSPFSTRDIILVDHKLVHNFSPR